MTDESGRAPSAHSEELYKSLFEMSPLPTAIYDPRGKLLRVNRAGALAFGFDGADAAQGVGIMELVHPDSRAAVAERMRFQLAEGEAVPPLEERFVRRDGSTFIGEAVAAPVTWRGAPAIHVIVRDVTEIRAAEERLRGSEERYRELFELSPEPMVAHDGRFVIQANRAAVRYFGIDPKVGEDVEIWQFLRDPEPEVLGERIRTMITTASGVPAIPVKVVGADGALLDAELISAPTAWDGKPVILSVFHDLTERLRASAALEMSEHRFAAVIDNAPLGIYVYELEPDGRLVLVLANASADTILGIEHEGLIGLTIEEAFPELVGTVIPSQYRDVAKSGEPLQMPRVDYDAAAIHGSYEVNCFQTSENHVTVMFSDVTERMRTEAELERHRENLERMVAERTMELAEAQREVDAIVTVFARAVEFRDPYTAGHQRRVAQLAVAMAIQLGISEQECEHIRVAAQLHDIGKLSIPAEILSKPGRLLPAEYELVKGHPWAAYEILADVDIGWSLAEMVGQHHERMDGSGYPRGLSGEEIMMPSRLLAVADVVEAMNSHRPYRPAVGRELALAEIAEHRGTLYDAEMVDACVAVMHNGFEFEDEA